MVFPSTIILVILLDPTKSLRGVNNKYIEMRLQGIEYPTNTCLNK